MGAEEITLYYLCSRQSCLKHDSDVSIIFWLSHQTNERIRVAFESLRIPCLLSKPLKFVTRNRLKRSITRYRAGSAETTSGCSHRAPTPSPSRLMDTRSRRRSFGSTTATTTAASCRPWWSTSPWRRTTRASGRLLTTFRSGKIWSRNISPIKKSWVRIIFPHLDPILKTVF